MKRLKTHERIGDFSPKLYPFKEWAIGMCRRKLRFFVSWILVIGFCSPALRAEDNGVIKSEIANLHYFQQLALQRNPALRVVRHQVAQAKGRKTQAGLYPNPTIGYHANMIGMHDANGAHGVFVRQLLPDSEKRNLEIDIAGSQLSQFQFQISLTEQRLKTDVAIAFGRLLIAQKRLETLQVLQQSTLESVQSIQQLVQAGQAGQHFLLQAQLENEQAYLQVIQAKQNLKTAWLILSSICAIEGQQIKRVTGELYKIVEPVSWDFIVDKVIQKNPQVALLNYRIQEQRIKMKRQEVNNKPDVEFMLSFRHDSLTDDDVANIQIGMPIPIFDNNRGNIASAKAELKALENELSLMKIKLRVKAGEVYRNYENARVAESRYRETMLPLAEKNLQVVRAGFEQRQLNYLAFLTAQRSFLRINLSYLSASEELFEAVSELNGQLLKEHLLQ
ncbi:MAG: TolC family protein [Planctomycetaceae bacterium]